MAVPKSGSLSISKETTPINTIGTTKPLAKVDIFSWFFAIYPDMKIIIASFANSDG